MERGDRRDGSWDGDPEDRDDSATAYPAAPVPAHERAWRHPSELGQAQWAMSEPPLVIGRGLLVTTGAFGALLGVALLWMLVPIGADTAPRVATAAPRSGGGDQVRSSPGTGTVPVVALGGAALAATPVVTLPAERVPPNTLRLAAEDPVETDGNTDSGAPPPPAAVVVMVEGSSFLLTTAAAVTGADDVVDSVAVTDDSDDSRIVTVVSVTQGVAMLSPADGSTAGLDVIGFSDVAAADAGDTVTLLGPESIEVAYPAPGETLSIDASSIDLSTIAEGTPLIDGEGALVALCTMSTDADGDLEVHVVPVIPLVDEATSTITIPSAPDDRSAWMGVQLVAGTDPAGNAAGDPELRGVVIAMVMPGSPAIDAGLRAGEMILSIDDRAVASPEDASDVMAAALPGDTAVLVVAQLGADGSIIGTRVVSVVLTAAVPSV